MTWLVPTVYLRFWWGLLANLACISSHYSHQSAGQHLRVTKICRTSFPVKYVQKSSVLLSLWVQILGKIFLMLLAIKYIFCATCKNLYDIEGACAHAFS